MRRFIFKNLFLVTFLCFFNSNLVAQWSTSTTVNNEICTSTGNQTSQQMISDGSGGSIIVWVDSRNGNEDIYAQKINSSGVVQWTTSGVAICTATDSQNEVKLTTDGSGGAIIVWTDVRGGSTGDIYAQRINSSGVVQWTANGVAICTATAYQQSSVIINDGSGGAFIVWVDPRSGNTQLWGQRVNSSGVVQWTANGNAICTNASSNASTPQIQRDWTNGFIVVWNDQRSGNMDIYISRLSPGGIGYWAADGIAVCTNASMQNYPQILVDATSGVFITWNENRNGNTDIYAQRLSSSAGVQWTANGISISSAIGSQAFPKIIADGLGGVLIAWEDQRGGTNDIYAQRVSSLGAGLWTSNGISISSASNHQSEPQLISDGSNGAFITWSDTRNGGSDIYAQRVNSSGVVQWTTNGVTVSDATGIQSTPQITSDGSSQVYITWADQRSGNSDIYIQKMDYSGNVQELPTITGSEVTSITGTTATSGGSISSDGGASVTARGVVWGTSTSPTVALSTKTSDNTGTGSFTSSITGLSLNTTYYIRAYATNSIGTEYGSEYTFTTLSSAQIAEKSSPNSGDGNGDGLQDVNQSSVASLLNTYTSKYITIVSLDGNTVSNSEIIAPPSTESTYHYPGSLSMFTVSGSTATVKLYFHNVTSLNGYIYRKKKANGEFFNFTNYTFGSEVINGKLVATATLTLTDGGPEDYDGVVNGSITDPGGPAILAANANIPIWDWRYLSLLVVLFGIGNFKINKMKFSKA